MGVQFSSNGKKEVPKLEEEVDRNEQKHKSLETHFRNSILPNRLVRDFDYLASDGHLPNEGPSMMPSKRHLVSIEYSNQKNQRLYQSETK